MKKTKRIVALLAALMLVAFSVIPVSAAASSDTPRYQDTAGLLDEDESEALTKKLDSISQELQVDIAIIAVNKIPDDAKSLQDYTDELFLDLGYGFGSDKDGVLLVVDMGQRKYHIATHGSAIKALSDSDISELGSTVKAGLSSKDYVSAFSNFADAVKKGITSYQASGKLNPVKVAAISLIIGLVVAFIVNGSMSAQLKSVKMQDSANYYTKDGSMKVTGQNDIFLFHTVSRTPKQTKSSGGGSTHRSSSGGTFGGGGGSF